MHSASAYYELNLQYYTNNLVSVVSILLYYWLITFLPSILSNHTQICGKYLFHLLSSNNNKWVMVINYNIEGDVKY